MTEPSPVARTPDAYAFWTDGRVRFGDLDALGHANNNAVGNFFDDARIEILQAMGVNQLTGPILCVVARITVEFLHELRMFEDVRVGQRCARIGRTSFVLHSTVFREGLCAATGEAVCVLIDADSRRPVPLPEAMKAVLEKYA